MNYKTYGEYFGFPNCCIEFFGKEATEPNWFDKYFDIYPGLSERIDGTGFIPCEKHMQMIVNNEVKPEQLIQNRQCKTPFPHGR
jgi:hypothetical protein